MRAGGRVLFVAAAARLAWAAWRDGRLSASPRRWLVDLRHLRGQMRAGAAARDGAASKAATTREAVTARRLEELRSFLASDDRLILAPAEAPVVSILVVVFNRAELTLGCLRALTAQLPGSVEVLVFDNASTDQTSELFARVDGVRVLRSPENVGFLRACNALAAEARGEFLAFVNNDAELMPGALASAVDAMRESDSVGAVGGRLILHDGSLQEAGGIVWTDGSCEGYGRGWSPSAGEVMFDRDVDYCSGALLVTRRTLFGDLGGFDERFVPIYYEDVDYCVRVTQSGRRVVFRPSVAAVHYEFASAGSAEAAFRMHRERRDLFAAKHRGWLAARCQPREAGALANRDRRDVAGRVLVIDDRPPSRTAGFGFPRAVELVRALDDLGYAVTVFCTAPVVSDRTDPHADVPPRVEVIVEPGSPGLTGFVKDRVGYYDTIIVSRSHNLELMRARCGVPSAWGPGARVVYDSEAVTAVRDIARQAVVGEPLAPDAESRLIKAETALAAGVDRVLVVSEHERALMTDAGPAVHVVSHAVDTAPTAPPFADRRGLLFVGAFHELSPNADAVLWFAGQVLPLIRRQLGEDTGFTVVGHDPPRDVMALRRQRIDVVAGAANLEPIYARARVFVAPTRFAAGIPLKVIHAAAAGVPVVATPLLQRQLGWSSGNELLVGEDPAGLADACVTLLTDPGRWNDVRSAALTRVQTDYSRPHFRRQLQRALA